MTKRYMKARVELVEQIRRFHETEEFKNWEKNPTEENLEKARQKRKEIVK